MAIKTLSVWTNVPDADRLKEMLSIARDRNRPVMERQSAISYLTGATKVLASIEKREALADYLRRQLKLLRANLHYTEDAHEHG